MTAKELKRIFSKGECLTLDAMRLYNDGKLNKKSMHEVEKHLLECNLCSGAVDGLNTKRIAEVNKLSEHIQRRLAVYMNTPPRVPFMRRFGFAIITGAVLLISGGTWWYLSDDRKNENPVLIDSSATNNNQKNSSTSDLKENSPLVISTESQSANTVPATSVNEKNSPEKVSGNNSTQMQNYPADLPGKENTLTVKQESPSTPEKTTPPDETPLGPNTKTANSNQPLRIKTIQIYPAVTHNDKQVRRDAQDGQLGRPSSSSAAFEIDEMPTFPGGTEGLRNYIISNFKSTPTDRSKLTRFSTGVLFVVNSKSGDVSAPEISFGISPEIDKELLRVINAMPNWTPGKKRGEVDIMIGITFE